MAAWVLRLSNGGYGAGVIGPGFEGRNDELRWYEAVDLAEPTAHLESGRLEWTGFLAVEGGHPGSTLVRVHLVTRPSRVGWHVVGADEVFIE